MIIDTSKLYHGLFLADPDKERNCSGCGGFFDVGFDQADAEQRKGYGDEYGHKSGCPVGFLESLSLSVEITDESIRWWGGEHQIVHGDTVQATAQEAATRVSEHRSLSEIDTESVHIRQIYFRANDTYVKEIADHLNALFYAGLNEENKRREKIRIESFKRERSSMMTALERYKSDYSEDGYRRKLAEINTRFAGKIPEGE